MYEVLWEKTGRKQGTRLNEDYGNAWNFFSFHSYFLRSIIILTMIKTVY